jgi:hypothetical protein
MLSAIRNSEFQKLESSEKPAFAWRRSQGIRPSLARSRDNVRTHTVLCGLETSETSEFRPFFLFLAGGWQWRRRWLTVRACPSAGSEGEQVVAAPPTPGPAGPSTTATCFRLDGSTHREGVEKCLAAWAWQNR